MAAVNVYRNFEHVV